jgi:hypothetical protein
MIREETDANGGRPLLLCRLYTAARPHEVGMLDDNLYYLSTHLASFELHGVKRDLLRIDFNLKGEEDIDYTHTRWQPSPALSRYIMLLLVIITISA